MIKIMALFFYLKIVMVNVTLPCNYTAMRVPKQYFKHNSFVNVMFKLAIFNYFLKGNILRLELNNDSKTISQA